MMNNLNSTKKIRIKLHHHKYSKTLIFVLFFLIYESPLFSSINMMHIVGMVSWGYIIFHYKNKALCINRTVFEKIFVSFAFITFYTVFITWINGESILLYGVNGLYWLIDIIPASIYISHYFKINKLTYNDFEFLIIAIGLIQTMFSILAFFVPSIQNYFVSSLIRYGYSDVVSSISYFRIYGFAKHLTSYTAYFQALLASIILYKAINENIKYLILYPFFLFSAIINARTSIVILVLGVLATLPSVLKVSVTKLCRIIISVIALIIGFNLLSKVLLNNIATYSWIQHGLIDINHILFGGEQPGYSYFDYLFNSYRWVLPSGLNLVFGEGHSIMGGLRKYGVYSDIGFVNDIWIGGIIYSIVIYWLFYRFVKGIANYYRENNFAKKLFYEVLLIGMLIIVNTKGIAFTINECTTFVILSFCLIKVF